MVLVVVSVFQEVMNDMPEYSSHLYNIPDKDDHFLLDLPAMIAEQAEDAEIDFLDLGRCTYNEEEYFFSFRRSTHKNEKILGASFQLSVSDPQNKDKIHVY